MNASLSPPTATTTFQPLGLLRVLANKLERAGVDADCPADQRLHKDSATLIRSCVAGLAIDDEDRHALKEAADTFDHMADSALTPKYMIIVYRKQAERLRCLAGRK